MILKRNDIGRAIRATLNLDGEPADLTGATVKLLWKGPTDAEPRELDPSIIDAENGVVQYVTTLDETGTAGMALIEWEVTFPDESILTFPESGQDVINVVPDLG